jgi:hypothetical protein
MGGGWPPRRKESNLHNTTRFSLLGWEDLGLSPTPLLLTRSPPRVYYSTLPWSFSIFSGFLPFLGFWCCGGALVQPHVFLRSIISRHYDVRSRPYAVVSTWPRRFVHILIWRLYSLRRQRRLDQDLRGIFGASPWPPFADLGHALPATTESQFQIYGNIIYFRKSGAVAHEWPTR